MVSVESSCSGSLACCSEWEKQNQGSKAQRSFARREEKAQALDTRPGEAADGMCERTHKGPSYCLRVSFCGVQEKGNRLLTGSLVDRFGLYNLSSTSNVLSHDASDLIKCITNYA